MKGKTIDAKSSPHYQRRGDQRPLSEADALALVREKDATGRRILDKGVDVPLGKPIGVRANLNVKKSTGITVQTMHDGTEQQLARRTGLFGGEAIGYGAAVTLTNVNFSVNQRARYKIATGKANKFPMASVDGRKAATGDDAFDGVEIKFNPMKHHLFVDPSGRAIKSAEYATVTGSSVFVRGKITYYDEGDAPKPYGDHPSEATFSLDALVELACRSKACAPPPVGTGGSKGGGHKVITAAMARGDSRPVSEEEFQRLGDIGRKQLDEFAKKPTGTKGLDENWDEIKAHGYGEVTQSWGGATYSSVTGKPLPQGVNKYAITVKTPGKEPVSIPENATREEFDAAMDEARSRFSEELGRGQHHLGVFHDDANSRIDIDPVLVLDNSRDVETIGVASHAIGGAYNFADGNGYWPPHVGEGTERLVDGYERTYET